MTNENHTVGNWEFLHSAEEDVNIIKFVSDQIRKSEQNWNGLRPWEPAVCHGETCLYGPADPYKRENVELS